MYTQRCYDSRLNNTPARITPCRLVVSAAPGVHHPYLEERGEQKAVQYEDNIHSRHWLHLADGGLRSNVGFARDEALLSGI